MTFLPLENNDSKNKETVETTTIHHERISYSLPPRKYTKLEQPKWVADLLPTWGERLIVDEFDESDEDNDDGVESNSTDTYRSKNGWKGRDLVHDRYSPVRITSYYVKYGNGEGLGSNITESATSETQQSTTTEQSSSTTIPRRQGGIGTTLSGIVVFTERAESHKGYCHGGSMCSIMDDVIGWCGFLVSGTCIEWSGYTVQINTRLMKPIPIHSTLAIQATITNIDRRKVFISATLWDPAQPDCTHSTAEGIFVTNKGIL